MEEHAGTSMFMEAKELYIKYRESREGKIMAFQQNFSNLI